MFFGIGAHGVALALHVRICASSSAMVLGTAAALGSRALSLVIGLFRCGQGDLLRR